jgi:N-acyl-D-amino-acid deacylase
MTSLPAQRFGLAGRGSLAPGNWADVVVFDPDLIRDEATYADPKREAAGINWVLVNGELTYDSGRNAGARHTGARAGRLLRFTE